MRKFPNNQKVMFVKTSDQRLDGQIGKIIGRIGRTEHYIVLFDQIIEGYDPSIAITEHCLVPTD